MKDSLSQLRVNVMPCVQILITLVPERRSLGTDDLMNEALYTLNGAVVHLKGTGSSGHIRTCYCTVCITLHDAKSEAR